jgi:UDP-N-acetylmuramoyl-L-alanyl-D-glutamate--2,6-diaminopimelate ligase
MHSKHHERIEDRRAAISRALETATSGDVIVLAGKGHETYQIRGTTKLPFDEKEIVHELTNGAAPRGTP